MQNPCFVIAHELYDALPIHQFEFTEERKWNERMISVDRNSGEFKFQANKQFTENVDKVLKPEKLFGKELEKEIKVGDSIEICPGALTTTQEIMSLIEVSRGSALIIDYGEDHAFSNSFRVTFFDIYNFSQGIKDHKLVKEFDKIIEEVG